MTRSDHDDIRADQTEAGRALRSFLAERGDRTVFLEHEVKDLLGRLGLTVPKGVFIGKGQTLTPPPLSYPLVAKVSSSHIVSKSDVGGVRTGISGPDELRKAVADLIAIKDAEGVIVEETAPPGTEVIVGGIVDSQFGPVVMFGLGGVFVELYRDVAFALAPLTDAEAPPSRGPCERVKAPGGVQGVAPH
ncbi:MAG: acetate--CoA ligase family protein [Bacillus subtilis]|nr:acetate--CoA ligase family protein [Bacillus subtilis]